MSVPNAPRDPPRPGVASFFGRGLRAATNAPAAAAGLLLAEWVAAAALWAPLVVVLGIAAKALAAGADPVHALAVVLPRPGLSWPLAGLALTLGLLGQLGRAAVWAGATGTFAAALRAGGAPPAPGTFTRSLVDGFPRLAPLALVSGALVALATAALWAGVAAAGLLWLQALSAGVAGTTASAGLALALALAMVGLPWLSAVLALAVARAGVLGEGPAAALVNAAALFGRRFFATVALLFVFRFGGAFLASLISTPGALVPPDSGWLGTLLVIGLDALAALAVAFASLAELGALVALVLEDAEHAAAHQTAATRPSTAASTGAA